MIENRKELKMELKASKYMRDRIKAIGAHAHNRQEKKIKKAEERLKELSVYQILEEAHEAYGWGYITEEEYEMLQAEFDGKKAEALKTDVDDCILALTKLFLNMLNFSITENEYLLMTPEQQEEYDKNREDIRKMKKKHKS